MLEFDNLKKTVISENLLSGFWSSKFFLNKARKAIVFPLLCNEMSNPRVTFWIGYFKIQKLLQTWKPWLCGKLQQWIYRLSRHVARCLEYRLGKYHTEGMEHCSFNRPFLDVWPDSSFIINYLKGNTLNNKLNITYKKVPPHLPNMVTTHRDRNCQVYFTKGKTAFPLPVWPRFLAHRDTGTQNSSEEAGNRLLVSGSFQLVGCCQVWPIK